ncbi:conserved protein, unknown function [Hepatocystis sp. ex Piliocolobus tephrosceles]|nr:conserved protein, unknown function [Hepatocystis sp. ex Piliocolobus tephrosceles]
MDEEIKAIEKDYKDFYEKFTYLNKNTFSINIIVNEDIKRKQSIFVKNNILTLVIKFNNGYFEILNENLETGYNNIFENIEQIFNTFCPITFVNFMKQKIKSKLSMLS